MLTDRQKRFVFEYCKDFVAVKAYIRAGYSDRSAAQGASALLDNPEVLKSIEEQKEMLAYVARLSPEWILHQWMLIASADPSELVNLKVRRCGNCWPMNDPDLPVNSKCPSCAGAGICTIILADIKKLSPAARRLFAGAKQTKDGVEIKMRDQEGALKNLADYLGMLNKSKGELAVGVVSLSQAAPSDLSDDQLLAIAAASESGNLGVSEGVVIDAESINVLDSVV